MAPADQRRAPAPALSPRETARWAWRQLTSMRTALLLLLLLALAAVPGSLVPQRGVDQTAVSAFFARHPDLAPVYDALGLFDVYSSVWFSAIYVLLMVSLLGCIVPRIMVYARALRARPPKAPKRLDRMPAYATFETDAVPADVLETARATLRRRRARIDVVPGDPDDPGAPGELRAETGYLREAGNLVFHVSLVVVLVGVAAGALLGYRGAVVVTSGGGFANTIAQYDELSTGSLFDPESDLPPFSMRLDDVESIFQTDGPQRGAPRYFAARGTYTDTEGDERAYEIEVNHPLTVAGTSVYLVGQGYAPYLRIRDGDGELTFEGAVPFLPQDATYTSNGVVKVPDGTVPLGFEGFFLPTAVASGDDEVPISDFPRPVNPYLGLFVWRGDLGLDDGSPQSVYTLDTDAMTQVEGRDGAPFRIGLQPGESVDLPDGLGSVEFVRLEEFARFQLADTPGMLVPLGGVVVGVIGLMFSLYVRPRRIWVRTRPGGAAGAGSRTVVEVAALDRISRHDLQPDLDALVARWSGDSTEQPAEEPRS